MAGLLPTPAWFREPAWSEHRDAGDLGARVEEAKPCRMPVQWVNRPNLDFRGFSGQVAGGRIAPGDAVRILPSGKTTTVGRIVTMDGDLDEAVAGQSVTLTLADEVDCSRGAVIAAADAPPEAAAPFAATLVWMADEAMIPGRAYWLKLGAQSVSATVQAPKYEINVNTLDHLAAKTLDLNGIGVVELSTDRPIVFEAYAENRALGGFILIDKLTNATVGAGMLHFSLRRAQNVHWQASDISREARAGLKNQKAARLWFPGLPGEGQATIADIIRSEQRGGAQERVRKGR